jgi:hypothetical protein
MKIYFLFLIAFSLSCQNQIASKDVTYNGKQITVNTNLSKNPEKTNEENDVISATIIKCGDKEFNLLVMNKSQKKYVNLLENNAIIKTINLPRQPDVNGFSLRWAREAKGGFEIAIDYGSRLYYHKNFSFICKQNNFYLSEVKITTFDKHNPETLEEYTNTIKPNLPLEKFSVTDYIGN